MAQSISRMATLASAVIMALVLFCGGMGFWAASQSESALSEIESVGKLVQRHMEADMMHDAIRGDITAAFLSANPTFGISLADTRKDLRDHIANFRKQVSEADALAHAPEVRATLDTLKQPMDAYLESADVMVARIEKDPATAVAYYPVFDKRFKTLEVAMGNASDMIGQYNSNSLRQEHRTSLFNEISVASSALLCLLVLAGLSTAVRKHLVRPLIALSGTARSLARGNYREEIGFTDRSDELGTMAQAMVELRKAGQDKQGLENAVVHTVQGIQTGSRQIAQASDELARRTELQAASLEQTVLVMENLTGSVRDTATSAAHVSQTVSAAQADAKSGGTIVRDTVSAMGGIEKSSQEISQIISVIDAIAFQTNLLALNAGVEAARAGDAGKGFAVVANEVRALAQRSAEAAKDIKQLINTSSRQVESGVKLVAQSGESLERIASRITEVAELIHQIAAAAEDQANGLQQINGTINDMGKSTQQNAAMVEESNAACRHLAEQAQQLNQLVVGFQGASDAPSPVERASQRSAPVAPVRQARPAVSSRTMPAVAGNLALAVQPDDDWTEF